MIFITGSTGFLGKYLVKELSNQSYILRCLVRKTSNVEHLRYPNIELFYGDLTSLSSLRQALKGASTLIHLANVYATSDKNQYHNVNIQSAKNLIKACKENNVKRVIYLSSVAAIRKYKAIYGQTKLEIENLFKKSGLDLTILRPELIYGNGGKEFEKIITLLKVLPITPVIGYGRHKRRIIYVGDVVSAIIASTKNRNTIGKAYNIVSSDEVSFNEIVDTLSQKMNAKKLKIRIPLLICSVIAKVLFLFSLNPPLMTDELHDQDQDIEISNKEAVKDLNFKPITFKKGIEKLHLS